MFHYISVMLNNIYHYSNYYICKYMRYYMNIMIRPIHNIILNIIYHYSK